MYGTHVGCVLFETSKPTNRNEEYPIKLVVYMFVLFFKACKKYHTDVRYFLLSFLLINVYRH